MFVTLLCDLVGKSRIKLRYQGVYVGGFHILEAHREAAAHFGYQLITVRRLFECSQKNVHGEILLCMLT